MLYFSLWTATVAVAVVRRDGAVEPAPSMLPMPTWLLRQRPHASSPHRPSIICTLLLAVDLELQTDNNTSAPWLDACHSVLRRPLLQVFP